MGPGRIMFEEAVMRFNESVMESLPRIVPTRRSASDPFHTNGSPIGLTLSDFWCWSASDLLSNTLRGVLAEFLVANALDISASLVRDPWGAFDLQTADGIKIEVKSAAYLQSWAQKKPSSIIFNVPRTRAWDPDTNELELEARRQADVYVFALLAHRQKETIDPLNVAQWEFYVLSRAKLDGRQRSQHSITLRSLERLSGGAVFFPGLSQAVRIAFGEAVENQTKRESTTGVHTA